MPKEQPTPSDFIRREGCDGVYKILVLDAGIWITVVDNQTLTKARQIEMAIVQSMVSYRIDRNVWEQKI